MITKTIRHRTCKLGDADITVKAKFGSQLSKQAVSLALHIVKQVNDADPEDLIALLAQGKTATEAVVAYEQAQTELITDLREAASALSSKPVTSTTGLVETCRSIRATANAIAAVDQTVDLTEVRETADKLLSASNAVENDQLKLRSRRRRAEGLLQEAVGIALARSSAPAAAILREFDPPQHWSFDPPPVAIDETFDLDEHYRRQARSHSTSERTLEAKLKRTKKRQAEAELRDQAAKIWEGAR